MQLDSKQLEAVNSDAAIRIIIAGPGSGKTRTLVEAVKKEIADGTPPSGIVVLTFTSAGAKEFCQRLEKDIGEVKLGFSGTRHSYLFRLLQKHGEILGYQAGGISIIDPDERDQLLKSIGERMGYKGSWKRLNETDSLDPLVVQVGCELAYTMKRSNLIDYDTILKEGTELAARHDIDLGIHSLYVDEAQDNSQDDWLADNLLRAKRRFIVGDPDQSIYAFRGGWPEGLVQQADNPAAHVIHLDINYRSDEQIVVCANDLIRNNKIRVKKEMTTFTDRVGRVGLKFFVTGEVEANNIIDRLKDMDDAGLNETAILARTNRLVDTYREKLLSAGIPVRTTSRTPIGESFQLGVSLISLMVNPTNEVLAERVACKLRGITVKQAREQYFAEISTQTAAGSMVGLKEEWCDLAPSTIPAMLSAFGIDKEGVEIIKERVKQLPPGASKEDLLVDLMHPEQWEAVEEGKGVTVSTIHGAKGREWDTVFLVGVEEGILPSTKKTADIEEERRLAFVAITRARHTLIVSSAATRDTGWGIKDMEVSRFTAEMGF